MKPWKKPVTANAILIAVLVLCDLLFMTRGSTTPFPRLMFSGTFILLLAPVNLVIDMVRNRQRKGDGPYYLLMAGLVLLIGFSVCSLS
jgi:hypothetical protein